MIMKQFPSFLLNPLPMFQCSQLSPLECPMVVVVVDNPCCPCPPLLGPINYSPPLSLFLCHSTAELTFLAERPRRRAPGQLGAAFFLLFLFRVGLPWDLSRGTEHAHHYAQVSAPIWRFLASRSQGLEFQPVSLGRFGPFPLKLSLSHTQSVKLSIVVLKLLQS